MSLKSACKVKGLTAYTLDLKFKEWYGKKSWTDHKLYTYTYTHTPPAHTQNRYRYMSLYNNLRWVFMLIEHIFRMCSMSVKLFSFYWCTIHQNYYLKAGIPIWLYNQALTKTLPKTLPLSLFIYFLSHKTWNMIIICEKSPLFHYWFWKRKIKNENTLRVVNTIIITNKCQSPNEKLYVWDIFQPSITVIFGGYQGNVWKYLEHLSIFLKGSLEA